MKNPFPTGRYTNAHPLGPFHALAPGARGLALEPCFPGKAAG